MFSYWHVKIKDTENDASKAGRYGHPWVTLPGDGDVRKAVWKRDIILSTSLYLSLFYKKGIWFTYITSYAVAPGQQSQTQHSVAETQHHTEHVQKTDHFRGSCTDQHCTHDEAQKSKELERDKRQTRTQARTCFIITAWVITVTVMMNKYSAYF